MQRLMLKAILVALAPLLNAAARRHKDFAHALRRHDLTAEIRVRDGSVSRQWLIRNGRVSSTGGRAKNPDVSMVFEDVATAATFLKPPQDMAAIVHAAKNFKVVISGDDDKVVWFMQTLNRIAHLGTQFGTPMPDGTIRYTHASNGGAAFVYVKEGRIVRITPVDLEESDAPSWSIHAKGREFRPQRRFIASPHTLALKSMVYSDRRLLHPMKRVDFDPDGERNPQNRGKSGYVQITWDEALNIVAREIKRQKRVHGPGSIAITHGSHCQWGNVGYWLSSLYRFGNLLGVTRMHMNPDSWEGWYWGAQHHFGSGLRVGVPSGYGTVEDCLKDAEQIVFWSSDPESTNGYAAGFEGTQRRLWAKELGLDFIHIEPHWNATAQLLGGRWIPVRPGTDSALALAIMHVWISEGTYDREYVRLRTTGFEQWKAYVLGHSDGIPKDARWQEGETGVPAYTVKALARTWARRRTYLAPGGMGNGLGGAGRSATGAQWARSMILLMAMQGWGKPGVNFGNLQMGTPLNHTFYFPGYAEGGISGELNATASAVNNYVRMPHVLTMNPVRQQVPRQRLPEAITEGRAKGYLFDGTSAESQFTAYEYPMEGYSRIHMLYRYGGSSFGTIVDSNRYAAMYRHESVEFVVNQSIWNEGDAKFADIILPACTSLERWDISEVAGAGGYAHHNTDQLNHRLVMLQHKCIEPLGESKSDYQIFLDILCRLGLGPMFSEGCAELDWVRRVFDSSDVPQHVSWKQFARKGYFVVPAPEPSERTPVAYRWFAEGRKKDLPEPQPLPSQYSEGFGEGLETQSGKVEFVSSSITRGDPHNPERPAMNQYIPAWEGRGTLELAARYPLQLVTAHPRYTFHTFGDGKDSTLNDVADHRRNVAGYYYRVIKINTRDALERGIQDGQLVRVYNSRGSVVCAAEVTALVMAGVTKGYESSSEYDCAEHPVYGLVDFGGCLNTLTPARPQMKGTDAMAANSCLVQVELWIDLHWRPHGPGASANPQRDEMSA